MSMNTERENLNKIYYPIHIKAFEILARFQCRIFEPELGWYNGHYSKDENGQYQPDYFPIPVISVKGYCDIEIGFEQITVSAKLKREEALSYSFDDVKDTPFEAYGVEDYLADYYNSDMTVEQLHENIKNSGEKEIGFSFVFDHDADKDILFDFAKLLRRKGFYY